MTRFTVQSEIDQHGQESWIVLDRHSGRVVGASDNADGAVDLAERFESGATPMGLA